MMTGERPITRSSRWRAWALLGGAAAWVTAFACVPSYSFDDPGADAGDAATSDRTAPSPDAFVPDVAPGTDGPHATDAGDASDGAVPSGAQIFVSQNELQGGMCAIRNGQVYCWGDDNANTYGQFGVAPIDASSPYLHPMPMPTMGTPTQIAMATEHTCSLYGRVVRCRGSNRGTQLGNASVSYSTPQEVPVTNLPPVDVIASSNWTTCGLVLDGYDAGSGTSNVWCWGYDMEGECGHPPNDGHDVNAAWPVTGNVDGGPTGLITDAVAIAGGGLHFCVLTAHKKIECWGANDSYESGPVLGPSCTTSQFAGWCSPQAQEVTLPNGEVPAEIALGDRHSCALAESGNVYCWGSNENNQLGNGGAATPTCHDAKNTRTWPCSPTPSKVVQLPPMQHVFAGGTDACAIDAAHHAWCWGNDQEGQSGNGKTNQNETTPHEILDMGSSQAFVFDEMALGGFKVCGRSGTAEYCWGSYNLGTQVGDAAPPPSNWPAPVQF